MLESKYMNSPLTIYELSVGGIVAISIISVLLFAGLIVLLYFTVIRKSVAKKMAQDAMSKFEHSHSVLMGDIKNYITRLKSISDVNITYIGEYNEWLKRFKDLRDSGDANCQSFYSSLEELVEEKRYKELRENYPKAKAEIDAFSKNVEEMRSGLESCFKEEAQVSDLAYMEKERYRSVKAKYANSSNDLRAVSGSFERLWKRIDSYINEAEDEISHARYGSARKIYTDKVDKILVSADRILDELPKMAVEIGMVLPDKISSLKNTYLEMQEDGYPLSHICQEKDFDSMQDELSSLGVAIQSLNLKGVNQTLISIRERLDSYQKSFEEEVEARSQYEDTAKKAYKLENEVSQSFINLKNSLPKIESIYLIDEKHKNDLSELSNLVAKASSSKRLLDNYVHGGSKQLYSALLERAEDLLRSATSASESLSSYRKYLYLLKQDTEKAAKSIRDYYKWIVEAEIKVGEEHIEGLSARFASRFAECHTIIDEIYEGVKASPIDVATLREKTSSLENKGESLLKDVEKNLQTLKEAEKSILIANRYRSVDSAQSSLLTQSEGLFFDASFVEARDSADSVTLSQTDR